MADIAFKQVTKKYKQNVALNAVSVDIKDKEFYVIFGPAGAGKTTLLNLIAGIVVPEEGLITMNGKVVNSVEPEDRNVAMVFENYALYPHMTVFNNMASPLRSPKYRRPETEIKEEVNRVAKILRIDWLLQRFPSELSNGQRQRVSLGRALVRSPEVFLMDEPLTHLDAKLRHQMRAEFKEMQTNLNTTTIYVTHDYLEALSLGDRIAVLNEGQIEQIGTPDDIYFRPATEFVAEAFGEPEINILTAGIVKKGEVSYLNLLGDSDHFTVPIQVSGLLEENSLHTVRVGFRPKDIKYSFVDDSAAMLRAFVYSFEPLGSKAILTAHVDGQLIRLVAPAELEVQPDQPIYLKFNVDEAIFFNTDTKRFIVRAGVKGGRSVG
jgi:multiple sugar transport system ATP-binding protein